ncbi:MAG: recombination mediator RecR [Clostridia bacterium]
MDNYIEPVEKLIAAFRGLPGVGQKTAQRYAYSIIKGTRQDAKNFAEAIVEAKEKVKYCSQCGNFTDKEVCTLCETRSHKIICVVKEPKDVIAMEKIKSANFAYHVLHGTISPLENRGPNDIRIKELLARVSKNKTEEVIVATNPDVEGDATALYISKILSPLGVKVSRIAQGISMGSELEFADEVTLTRAIEARRQI